jgi:hypothetical protein
VKRQCHCLGFGRSLEQLQDLGLVITTHCRYVSREPQPADALAGGQVTSTSIAPVYDDWSLEDTTILLELSQGFGGARSALDNASNLITTKVLEDVGELIACRGSFLDVCKSDLSEQLFQSAAGCDCAPSSKSVLPTLDC